MSLDHSTLEKPRCRGGKLIARCPACAEQGADKAGEHLFISDDGRFGCIAFTGPAGDAHRKRIWELAGDGSKREATAISPRFVAPAPVVRPSPRIPPLRPLTIEELSAVAHSRGWLYFAGLQLLAARGLLWFGMVWDDGRDWPAWIITDATRRNAQARRLDGKQWTGIDAKAKTLKACDPSWPIGAPEIGHHHLVLLCEGQPDFAAALLVSWWYGVEVAPVCMTGAGNSIHPDALHHFKGKHIRIAIHDDDAGRAAGAKWAKQLYAAGAELVDRFDFHGMARGDGQPVSDLADYATLLDPDAAPIESIFQ